MTTLVQPEMINASPLTGFRNKIINGDFDVWQRETSDSLSNETAYVADRWQNGTGSSGAATVSRQTFTLGQTDVPGNPRYFMRHDQTVGGGSTFILAQRVEDARTLSGETATFTFYAKVSSGTIAVDVDYSQNFGTGGSPSTENTVTIQSSETITTSWQKFQYVFDIDSISGKTLGTNSNDFLRIRLVLPASTTFTLDIAHVSLVPGDATDEDDPFSSRHIQQELTLCQRYYEKSYSLDTAPGAIAVTGSVLMRAVSATSIYHTVYWKTSKRDIPTVTVYSTDTGASGKVYNGSSGSDVNSSLLYTSINSYVEAAVADGAAKAMGWHWTADAEI